MYNIAPDETANYNVLVVLLWLNICIIFFTICQVHDKYRVQCVMGNSHSSNMLWLRTYQRQDSFMAHINRVTGFTEIIHEM